MAEESTGSPGNHRFGLDPAARIKILRIGRSREPVIVVDHALLDPEPAIDEAALLRFAAADEGRGGFPGVRAQAPRPFAETLIRGAMPLVEQVFGLKRTSMSGFDASFSIVSSPPDALHPLQRIPHVDTRDPRRLAILYYLGRGKMGGTAFYRQDSTGLEQIGPDSFDSYYAARRGDLALLPAEGGYPDSKTPGYTETAYFEARFNRLLVYRSCSLHSGVVPSDSPLIADPRVGRLTANIFVDFDPD